MCSCAPRPYQLFPKQLPTEGIIIHGSGLVRGGVSRLLRARLDRAVRAALLARSLGLADEAVGGPTAFYYVPSATLREFLAVLSYRKVWFALSFLPALGLVALLVRAATLYA